jgi:hypothetical protein
MPTPFTLVLARGSRETRPNNLTQRLRSWHRKALRSLSDAFSRLSNCVVKEPASEPKSSVCPNVHKQSGSQTIEFAAGCKPVIVTVESLEDALQQLRSLPNKIGKLGIECLLLDVRVKSGLLHNGLRTIADLRTRTAGEIANYSELAPSSLPLLERWLRKFVLIASWMPDWMPTICKIDAASESSNTNARVASKSDKRSDPVLRDLDLALKLLETIPEHDLETAIVDLPVSVRLRGALLRNGIKELSALKHRNAGELAAFRQMGRKSLIELNQLLAKLQAGSADDNGFRHLLFVEREKDRLVDQVSAAMSDEKLQGSRLRVLIKHWGLDGRGIKSLQKTGELLGISRERARQLEQSAFKVLNAHVGQDLRKHVDRLRTLRKKPVYMELLGIEDPYFSGIEEALVERGMKNGFAFMVHLISTLCNEHVIEWNGKNILSRLPQSKFEQKRRRVIAALESCEGLGYDLLMREVDTVIDEDESLSDLRDVFLKIVESKLLVAHLEDGRSAVMKKRSSAYLVKTILESSPEPMYYSQVVEVCRKKYARDIDEGTVLNILISEAHLYGRGHYGLLKHLNLADEVIVEMARLFTSVIESGPVERQWHASELLDYLPREVFPESAKIDKYIVDIVMTVCKVARTLNRLIWVRHDSEDCLPADRRSVEDCIEDVLIQAGTPLTHKELMARVTAVRGVSNDCQPKRNERIVRIDRKLWGLLDRDVRLSPSDRVEFLESLFRYLKKTGQPLSIMKAMNVLPEAKDLGLNPTLIASLVKYDERFRCTRHKDLVLSEWDDVTSLRVPDAIMMVLGKAMSPLKAPEVAKQVNDILGYEIDSRDIAHRLWHLPEAKFDRMLDGWVLR